MNKFNNIKQHLYIIAVLAILLFGSYNNQQIYGHNFAGELTITIREGYIFYLF